MFQVFLQKRLIHSHGKVLMPGAIWFKTELKISKFSLLKSNIYFCALHSHSQLLSSFAAPDMNSYTKNNQ